VSDIQKNCLFDLGYLFRDRELDAKNSRKKVRGTEGDLYQSRRAMAYYPVMSLVVSQADAFQLPIEGLHLEGVDPDHGRLRGGHTGCSQSVSR
jgi:hypothetical protein